MNEMLTGAPVVIFLSAKVMSVPELSGVALLCVGGLAWPINMRSKKDAGKRERATPNFLVYDTRLHIMIKEKASS